MNDAKQSIDTADFGDLFASIDKALKTRVSSKYSALPYKQSQGIVLRPSISDSGGEETAFDRLFQKWNSGYFVFTQVHLWRLCARPFPSDKLPNYLVDFALCDRNTGEVLLAIEHDGMRDAHVGPDNEVIFKTRSDGKRERLTKSKVNLALEFGAKLLYVGKPELEEPIVLDAIVGEAIVQHFWPQYKSGMISHKPPLSLENVDAVAYHHAIANIDTVAYYHALADIDVVDLEIAGMRHELEKRHTVSVSVKEKTSGATAIVTVDDIEFVGEDTLREHSVLDDVLRVARRLAEYRAFCRATDHFATEGEA
jgi:hypothetical protein